MRAVTESIAIAAPPEAVWAALIAPDAGEAWRGAAFDTDWLPGSPIAITAIIGSKHYRDKGEVLRAEPPGLLAYRYWSSVSGVPDAPDSYSTITLRLAPDAGGTILLVEQQVPPSPERRGKDWIIGAESGRKHVEFYWRTTLPLLKRAVEEPR